MLKICENLSKQFGKIVPAVYKIGILNKIPLKVGIFYYGYKKELEYFSDNFFPGENF